MPAVLLMPFIFFFGTETQTIFAILIASINVVLVYFLINKLNVSKKTSILVSLFFALGTSNWYLASIGSAWFIAHIIAVFFLLLSLIETFGKRRFWLIGFLLGASFWSRSTEIFTLPFFYIFFWKKFWPLNKQQVVNFLKFNIGVLFFILLDFVYNYLRFGSISALIPYQLIPNIDNDPIFSEGFTNIKYIPRHIDAILFRLPKLSNQFPYLIPSLYSTAVWFTSPLLIYIFKARKNILTISCWAAICFTMPIIFLWGGVGFAHFGYRFIMDVIPFLLILLAQGIGRNISKFVYFLLILSIIANGWGVILINKFSIFSI